MGLLAACLALHLLAVQIVGSSWWVPHLTLIGLVLAVAQAPARWLRPSLVAGIAMSLWAIRFPGQIVLSYLLAGWLVRWAAGQWDARDARVQLALIAGACAGMTAGTLWLERLWSLPLAGLAVWQVASTCAVLPIVRRTLENRLFNRGRPAYGQRGRDVPDSCE